MTPRPFEAIPLVERPDDFFTNVGPILAALYEQHGPIFRAKATGDASIDIVYLVGPEANRFVLQTDRQKLSHRDGWGKFYGVLDTFGDGLLTMDGERHDDHRRLMNPAFTLAYMDRYVPIMNRIIRQHIADWAARAEVDVYSEARKITFEVAAEALAGLTTPEEVEQFRELYTQILMLGMVATTWEEFDKRMTALHSSLYALLERKIAERRAQPTDDVLGLLAQARDAQGNALSDEQLIAHTNVLLVAGHETSTSLSAWMLYLLAGHPDYLARVLAEQDALLAPDALPSLEDIKRMKVLDNALSEAERLYPPLGNGPRGALEDVEFGGYTIPKGTIVFYSIAATHLLPSLWREPERFDPDRFNPPREEQKRVPYALVGFGGGPRVCIGLNFARVEMKALASQVLRRYTLDIVPDQELVQLYRPTAMPLNGIKLQVRERTATASR